MSGQAPLYIYIYLFICLQIYSWFTDRSLSPLETCTLPFNSLRSPLSKSIIMFLFTHKEKKQNQSLLNILNSLDCRICGFSASEGFSASSSCSCCWSCCCWQTSSPKWYFSQMGFTYQFCLGLVFFSPHPFSYLMGR